MYSIGNLNSVSVDSNSDVEVIRDVLSGLKRQFVKASRENRPGAELLRMEVEFLQRELFRLAGATPVMAMVDVAAAIAVSSDARAVRGING